MIASEKVTKNRSINFLLGLTVALGFIFISFEYTSSETVEAHFPDAVEVVNYVEQAIPVTTRKQQLASQPKPPAPILNVFKIQENIVELDEAPLDIIDEKSERPILDIPDAFSSENNEEVASNESFFTVVEEMPRFPGGHSALMAFLNKQIRYPQLAVDYGLYGRVFVQFVVSKNGEITNIKVVKGVHDSLDNEAIRVVKKMPKWIPGEQRGKKVAVQFSLPISFTLN